MSREEDIPSRPDWEQFRQSMGYSPEEMATFRAYPSHEYVVEHTDRLNRWLVVAEVIESHGCAAGHRAGEKLYFSPHGVFEAGLSPARICLQAFPPLATAVAVFQERIVAGLDPAPYLFDRVGCLDVGVRCGGWGHVAFRLYPVKRE